MCKPAEYNPPQDVQEQAAIANLAALYLNNDVNPVCIAPGCECRN